METRPRRGARVAEPAPTPAAAPEPAPAAPDVPAAPEIAALPMMTPAPETPEAAEPPPGPQTPPALKLPPVPEPAAPPPVAAAGEDALAALLAAQSAVARGLTAMTAEIAALASAGIDAATHSATDLLSARTLADAIEINAGFARHSLEALLGGSARLSEIAVRLATEAARPIIAQLSHDWVRPVR
jgi:phasin family protein